MTHDSLISLTYKTQEFITCIAYHSILITLFTITTIIKFPDASVKTNLHKEASKSDLFIIILSLLESLKRIDCIGSINPNYKLYQHPCAVNWQVSMASYFDNLLADLLFCQTFFCQKAWKELIHQTFPPPNFPAIQ